MMFLAYAVSFMDRQIVSVLVEPMKAELQLSDGQVGVLTGLSFALFYCVMSLPIAALSDRFSRKRIIVIAMAFWSVMTALFGLADSYTELFLARMGVGIGEAAFAPAAFSMIADHVPAERRSAAIGLAAAGSTAGTMLGLMMGGYVTQQADWRTAMLVASLPGILLAIAFGLIVREPERGSSGASAMPAQDTPVFSALARNPTYLLVVGSGMAAMGVLFACVHWFPAYLIRSYRMTEGEAGALLGPLLGIVGAASLFGGGYVTDRLARRDVRWRLWIPAIGALAGLPLLACALYVEHRSATLTLFGLAYFAVMIQNAPITALIQELVPLRLRARATAVFLLMTTLTGFGIGPTVAGFLSEAYRPALGADSLRYALITLTPLLLISAALLARAAPRLVRSATLRFDRIEQLGVVERFQKHLARAGLRRRLQQRGLASGGDHDRREIGIAGTQGAQQFDSTDPRQADVRDQAVDLAEPARAEQRLGRGAQQNLVAGVFEQAFECLEHTRVVFHEGNEKRGQPEVS